MNTAKDRIDLLAHELLHEVTEGQKEQIENWMEKEPDNRKLHRLLHDIELSPEIARYAGNARESIRQEINHRIQNTLQRRLWLKISAVAASVLLLVSTTGYIAYHQGYNEQNSQLVRLENPLGTKSRLTLPDGSHVTLNAGTILTYPAAFVGDCREVEVWGEAFFEVTKDAHHPFIVKAQQVSVRVLGTQFNVKAYDDEDQIEVTLEEGSVDFSVRNESRTIRMKPGEQVTFTKTRRAVSQQTVNLDYYTSWKEGKFYFKNERLGTIARQLERKFNVQLHIASEKLENTTFTGDFVRGENLEQILKVMVLDNRISYRIEGDQIYISEQEQK